MLGSYRRQKRAEQKGGIDGVGNVRTRSLLGWSRDGCSRISRLVKVAKEALRIAARLQAHSTMQAAGNPQRPILPSGQGNTLSTSES